MNNNLISVVIPIYNNRDTIKRAVCSALSQSYSNSEIIVVDDGSTDNGLELAEKLGDRRVHCHRLPHRNANVARNYGIMHSRGTYIAMLDGDDEWKENHLESSLDTLRTGKADGVYGSLILRKDKDQTITTRAIRKGETVIDFLLANGYGAQTSTMFMTAASAKDILWDETLNRHQDYDFMVRYCKKYRMCPKTEATTIYHPSNAPKDIDFASCIRFIRSVKDEITDRLYMNYHLHMLRLAVAQSADEAIISHYRREATRYEYLISLQDYLILRNPQNHAEAWKMKMEYLRNILRTNFTTD